MLSSLVTRSKTFAAEGMCSLSFILQIFRYDYYYYSSYSFFKKQNKTLFTLSSQLSLISMIIFYIQWWWYIYICKFQPSVLVITLISLHLFWLLLAVCWPHRLTFIHYFIFNLSLIFILFYFFFSTSSVIYICRDSFV